jgi:hypothetical protein
MVISASERIEFTWNPARTLCTKKRVIVWKMKTERIWSIRAQVIFMGLFLKTRILSRRVMNYTLIIHGYIIIEKWAEVIPAVKNLQSQKDDPNVEAGRLRVKDQCIVIGHKTLEPSPIVVDMSSEFENNRKLLKAVAEDFVNKGDEPAWLLEALQKFESRSKK